MPLIKVGELEVELKRKDIKNLRLSVSRRDGSIRVFAPKRMPDNTIYHAVANHIDWIKKQKDRFAKQHQHSRQEMVSGEYYFLWGNQYQLHVMHCDSKPSLNFINNTLELFVPKNATLDNKKSVLESHYRFEIKKQIEKYLPKWEKIIGVSSNAVGLRKMTTRWGSCNTRSKKIWLNIELVKKPIACLEYVIVHELVHLLESSHNHVFKSYMDQFLPNWREIRKILNAEPIFRVD